MVRRDPKLSYSLLVLGLILVIALGLVFLTNLKPLWVWLVAINLATLVAYGYDKAQAQAGRFRVPEIVLHGLALAGGFLGGWLGRSLFHHKTRKPIFAVILTLSTVIWLVIIWLSLRG